MSGRARSWFGWLPLWAMLLGLLALGTSNAPAQTKPAGELPKAEQERLVKKIQWLYQFSIYTEWPSEAFPNSEAPFVVGLLGTDPLGDLLEAITKKTVKNRRVEVKKCDSVETALQCHLLFISSSEKDKLSEILRRLKDARILTVGEAEDFTKLGGVINLTIGQSDPFEFSLQAEKRAKLVISSDLKGCGKKVP